MLKLKEELLPATLMAKDLEDGQLAVIVEDFSNYKGRIIQKYEGNIVSIGMTSGNGWYDGAATVTLKVRILEDGELLTVLNNKCYGENNL